MSSSEHNDGVLLDMAYPYAMDAVTAAERRRVEVWRAAGDRIAAAAFDARVADTREVLASMTEVDSLPPPAHVEQRLMRALDDQLRKHDAPRSKRARPGFPRWTLLAAAVAILLAVSAGVVAVVQRAADPGVAEITAQMVREQPDVRTRSVPVSSGGAVQVSTSVNLMTAAVEFHDVPPPGAGRSFQVWLVPTGGTPRSAAVMESAPADGGMTTSFQAADTLAITIEPAGGSEQPTTTPIASIGLGR